MCDRQYNLPIFVRIDHISKFNHNSELITSLGPRSRRVRVFQTFRILLLLNFFSFRDVFSIDKKGGSERGAANYGVEIPRLCRFWRVLQNECSIRDWYWCSWTRVSARRRATSIACFFLVKKYVFLVLHGQRWRKERKKGEQGFSVFACRGRAVSVFSLEFLPSLGKKG